jgi:type I restriction enzyme M protein
MSERSHEQKTKELIDNLRAICTGVGLSKFVEFKIITEVFLYKFLNDKFGYEVKKILEISKTDKHWEEKLTSLSNDEYELLMKRIPPHSAILYPRNFISTLWNQQNTEQFFETFNNNLLDIAFNNNDIFAVKTEENQNIQLFDGIKDRVAELSSSKQDDFARAIINQLIDINFEEIYENKFDFFSEIYEYLIQEYNTNKGGTYAEYYTPSSIAKIISSILVSEPDSNVTIYDPSSGSGTLLMHLAQTIGVDNCYIYSQDINAQSTSLLRINLILNNLVHSLQNIVQGNTIKDPFHKENNQLMKFDYIVANPPFKTDYSDWRDELDNKENIDRFPSGIPAIPKQKDSTKEKKMDIYSLFIQHIIYSMADNGKAAIVVPTGFITSKQGVPAKVLKSLIDNKILKGVVSMPGNIFAQTPTMVSVIFLEKNRNTNEVVLIDASQLGETKKNSENQLQHYLSEEDGKKIIETFNNKLIEENFSVVTNFEKIIEEDYKCNAGRYYDVVMENIEISEDEFNEVIKNYKSNLQKYFNESNAYSDKISKQLDNLDYDN